MDQVAAARPEAAREIREQESDTKRAREQRNKGARERPYTPHRERARGGERNERQRERAREGWQPSVAGASSH